MSAALASFRPRDESVRAVQAAIGAAADERRSAERRLKELRAARANALLDPRATTKSIGAIEAETRESEILIERLDAIRPQLLHKLANSKLAEKEAEIDRKADAAAAAVASFKVALAGYADLAAGIAAICQLDRNAQTAINEARRAASALGSQLNFDHPGFNGKHFADIVVLPAMAGSGMIWGTAAPPAPLYATRPVVV